VNNLSEIDCHENLYSYSSSTHQGLAWKSQWKK